MTQSVTRFFLFAACSLLLGCVEIRERYHIRASQTESRQDSGERSRLANTNYYRVTVTGWTCFSVSQYASGWYDSAAVDSLFGELKGKTVQVDRVNLEGFAPRSPPKEEESQENNDTSPKTTDASPTENNSSSRREGSSPTENDSSSGSEGSPSTSTASSRSDDSSSGDRDNAKAQGSISLSSLQGDPITGKKLVLFLSTNSDALVNQISAVASKNTIQNTLTAMLLAGEIEEREAAKYEAQRVEADDSVLAGGLKRVADALKNDASPAAVRRQLLRGLRAVARHSARPVGVSTITSAESALNWLESNPDAFRAPAGGAR